MVVPQSQRFLSTSLNEIDAKGGAVHPRSSDNGLAEIGSRPELKGTPWVKAAGLGLLMLLASLVGTWTMPAGFLASFWPANPLLLGLMVRQPELRRPIGWIAAAIGYIAADLPFTESVLLTLWLTAANISGTAAGLLFFLRLSQEDRALVRPASPLYLVGVCVVAGGTAAAVGGGAGALLMGENWLTSTCFWFVTEIVNGILLLPVILTAPAPGKMKQTIVDGIKSLRSDSVSAVPVLMLVGLMLSSLVIGGPGAIMFSTPALLCCALTYRLFTTAVITSLFCAWALIGVATGALPVAPLNDYIFQTMSLQLGISLMALGPLTASSMNAAREELLENLNHSVNHDDLTGVLGRRAFMKFGKLIIEKYLQRFNLPERRRIPADEALVPVVLMMDIDHFKSVNDRFGHAVGDLVIVTFTRTISSQLREGDLLGRLGGEEFAVLLPHITIEDAEIVAERLRKSVESTPVLLPGGEELRITGSFGISYPDDTSQVSLEVLLSDADQALYWSKSGGRNRVSTYTQEAARLRLS